MKREVFSLLTSFEVKAATTPTHDPETINTDGSEIIKISGYANMSGNLDEGEVLTDLTGDVVCPSGIDLTVYKSNPQILLQHDRSCTIGRCIEVTKKKDGLFITAEIHSSAMSEEDFYRIKSGLLSRFSVGFRTLEVEYRKVNNQQVCFIKKCLLMEVSVVGLPACPEAAFQIIKALPEGEGFYSGELGEQTKNDSGADASTNKGEDMELSAEQIKALAVAVAAELKAVEAIEKAEQAKAEAEEKAIQEAVEKRLAEAEAAKEAERVEAEAAELVRKEEAEKEEIKSLAEMISGLKKALEEAE